MGGVQKINYYGYFSCMIYDHKVLFRTPIKKKKKRIKDKDTRLLSVLCSEMYMSFHTQLF